MAVEDEEQQMASAAPSRAKSGLCGRATSMLALISITLILLAYQLATKYVLAKESMDPLFFCLLRDLSAWPLLQIAAVYCDGWQRPKLSEIPRFAALGLTGIFGNQYLYVLCLSVSNPNLGAVLTQAMPAMAFALCAAIGLETFSFIKAAGVIMSVIGSVLTVGFAGLAGSGAQGTILGSVFALGAQAAAVLWYVLMKPVVTHWGYPSLMVTAWSYFFATVFVGLTALIHYEDWSSWTLTLPGVYGLIVAVVFNSCIKFALLTWLNQRDDLDVTTIALVPSALFLPLSFVGDALLLDAALPARYIYGGIMVIVGVSIVIWGRRREQTKPSFEKVSACQRCHLKMLCDISDSRQFAACTGGAADGDNLLQRSILSDCGGSFVAVT